MGGGDKARIRIGDKTILERVLARLAPQCGAVIINANGDPARFADTGLPVVTDSVPDFAGPLAGVLAGLDWAAANAPGVADLVSVPGDCPFLPADLVTKLSAARDAQNKPLACARSGDWRHPVVGLWPVALRDDLRKALLRGRSAQDRGLDRAAWRGDRRLAGQAGRPVLQRQHPGGCRRGQPPGGRIPRPLSARPVAISMSSMLECKKTGGNLAMKAFVIACIAAAVIAVGAVYVLGEFQKPVETAYTTSGVRI